MADIRDARLTVELRPIEIGVLLAYARSRTTDADPLGRGDMQRAIERTAWDAIHAALLKALAPPK